MHYRTNFTEQNPSSEANSSSDIYEFPHILWNLEFHYRVRNGPLLVSIQFPSHPPPLHPPSYSLKMNFRIILPSTRLGLQSRLIPSGSPPKSLYAPLLCSHTCHMPSYPHLSLLDLTI
jgi:hypothetical protein